LGFYVRLMCLGDIPQVNEIDREAFSTQWPPTNFHHELKNSLAHYIVVCETEKVSAEPEKETAPDKKRSGLISRVKQLFSNRPPDSEPPPVDGEYVVGFAGFWIMAGEAHITSIAVRHAYQRRGMGEMLMIFLTELAVKLNSRILTLEVRASNVTAQNLYAKYGFTGVGLRRGYYTDNREDAILMSTAELTSEPFQACFQQLKQAHAKKWGAG
jgi:ribosomal-protein-alanine N-acetyltransferase